MLPPFIIEQIRRREEEQERKYEQPQLELPITPSPPYPAQRRDDRTEEEGQRGVIILEVL